MGEDKNRRPIRTPHHTKQQIPANKQKPQKTTIIPMKLNPANKQTTFEKRLPINVIHLENYRYQNRDPGPYTNEERKELSESGLDPGRTNSYKKKETKEEGRKEGREKPKKKKKKKKKK